MIKQRQSHMSKLVVLLLAATLLLMQGQRPIQAKSKWQKKLDQYRYNTKVNQLVFVKYRYGAKAIVNVYTKTPDNKWKRKINCHAYVGKRGINKKREGDMRTPSGTFGFTGAFGIKKNPGAKMKYLRLKSHHYWCGDKKYYNTLVDLRKHPHRCVGEHLIKVKPQYNYGLFLNFNPKRKYKKGSGIFLHCTKSGRPFTSGCIAVKQKQMIKILKMVDKNAKIYIAKK